MKKYIIIGLMLSLFIAGIISCQASKHNLRKYDKHDICEKYKNWVKAEGVFAYDKSERVYFVFTCKNRIVFLSAYNTLLYSKRGKVIGFQVNGVFHFHSPKGGWKNVNTSDVGTIRNDYENYKYFRRDVFDFFAYFPPPTLVRK